MIRPVPVSQIVYPSLARPSHEWWCYWYREFPAQRGNPPSCTHSASAMPACSASRFASRIRARPSRVNVGCSRYFWNAIASLTSSTRPISIGFATGNLPWISLLVCYMHRELYQISRGGWLLRLSCFYIVSRAVGCHLDIAIQVGPIHRGLHLGQEAECCWM